MDRWEYKIDSKDYINTAVSTYTAWLNRIGAEGWELIERTSFRYTHLFKRRMPAAHSYREEEEPVETETCTGT